MTETRRPTNPAAEEILGLYFPVLDHGFVSLVDYMGSDEDVERAARVSYGYGTRRSSQTRGLVRYLRRHRHTTPSEMIEFKFHCCMPVFVARQWIRHRTACLAEGTRVHFDLPGGVSRRGNQLYSLPIEDLYRRFQPTRNVSRPDKQKNAWFRRDRVQQMLVRQMDEATFALKRGRIADAFDSGVKPVVRMRLADGKTIECTPDHRFHFSDGWATLTSRTGLSLEHAVATWKPGDYFVYVNGSDCVAPALYTDRRWLDDQYNGRSHDIHDIAEACGASTHTVRKWLRVHGLTNGARTARRAAPWNKGVSYRLGTRQLSTAWIEGNQLGRSGAASNFWKGGVTPQRASIGRWTSQRAHLVHERNGWTCQLCLERSGELHVHHVVPVWADPSLAREDHNLTTLCGPCHRTVNGDELEYVERLGGPVVRTEWRRRPRVAWNKLAKAKLVRIEAFEYVGPKRTYDLEIVGPDHNFVANGIVTHNSVNEYSGRYSLLPLLFYQPAREHLQAQSLANKQGRAGAPLDALYADVTSRWDRLRADASRTYEWLVEQDVAREIARIDLPLSVYTQWYWKIDLHNLLHFLKLRVDPHAQYEIRAFAEIMAGMVQRVAPLSFEAWYDYEFQGAELSRGEMEALRKLIAVDDGALVARAGARVDQAALSELGLSVREVEELQRKLASAPPRVDFTLDPARARSGDDFAREMAAAVPRVDRET